MAMFSDAIIHLFSPFHNDIHYVPFAMKTHIRAECARFEIETQSWVGRVVVTVGRPFTPILKMFQFRVTAHTKSLQLVSTNGSIQLADYSGCCSRVASPLDSHLDFCPCEQQTKIEEKRENRFNGWWARMKCTKTWREWHIFRRTKLPAASPTNPTYSRWSTSTRAFQKFQW